MAKIVGVCLALGSEEAKAVGSPGDLGAESKTGFGVDLESRVVRFRRSVLPFPEALGRPTAREVLQRAVKLGKEKSLLHVRVTSSSGDVTWEVIGFDEPLWSGFTGFTTDGTGTRQRSVLRFVETPEGTTVVVGRAREDLGLCGESETLFEPRALDADRMVLRPASVQQLALERRDQATPLKGTLSDAPRPLAELLVATGSSGSRGAERALRDGDPNTSWHEERTGSGRGEFVVFAAPGDIGVTRMAFRLAPANAAPAIVPPGRLFVATDSSTFVVDFPEEALSAPGKAVEVTFPAPLRSPCLAVVLESALGRERRVNVGLAEVVAYSSFDGSPIDRVVSALSGGGAQALEAMLVLKRGGEEATSAIERGWNALDSAGRRLALEAETAFDCGPTANVLVLGLTDADRDVWQAADRRLVRCAPSARLALVRGLGNAGGEGRARLRRALGLALKTGGASELAALLSDASFPKLTRVDLLRAATPRLAEVPEEAEHALEAVWDPGEPRSRYLLITPLSVLARLGSATATARLVDAFEHDPDPNVRVRAAEVLRELTAGYAPLVGGTRDAEPRVREAAFRALRGSARDDATAAIVRGASDEWGFVRLAAIEASSGARASTDLDRSLEAALDDRAIAVRVAAAEALARRSVRSSAGALGRHVAKIGDALESRLAAARALGTLCARSESNRLWQIAETGLTSPRSADERTLALVVLETLHQLAPSDWADRFVRVQKLARPDEARAFSSWIGRTSTCTDRLRP